MVTGTTPGSTAYPVGMRFNVIGSAATLGVESADLEARLGLWEAGPERLARGGGEDSMGFRMRKSMKIAPGVKLNVSKKGVGASAGAGGVRYSAHSTGRRTVSARSGVPGVYYQKSVGSGQSKGGGAPTRPTSAQPEAPPDPKKPGMFAPKGEKELYKAVKAQDAQAMERVGVEHPEGVREQLAALA